MDEETVEQQKLASFICELESLLNGGAVAEETSRSADNRSEVESSSAFAAAVKNDIQKFTCDKCKYKSKFKANLRKHVQAVHEKLKDYPCKKCAFIATSIWKLAMHVKTEHHKAQPIQCPECNYKTTFITQMKYHIKGVHRNLRTFKCDECDFMSPYPGSVGAHKRTVHLKIRYSYACSDCNYKTIQPFNMRRHMRSVHLKTVEVKNLKMYVDTDFLKNLPHACPQCNHHAKTPKSLKLHIKYVHDDVPSELKVISIAAKRKVRKQTSDMCELEASDEDDMQVADIDGQSSPNADICHSEAAMFIGANTVKTKETSDINGLASSQNVKARSLEQPTQPASSRCELGSTYCIKSDEVQFSSEEMSKSADNQGRVESLLAQAEAAKKEGPKFMCDRCSFKSKLKANLRRHVKAVHEKLSTYPCSKCDFIATSIWKLATHVKTEHHKAQPIQCPECKYQTTFITQMNYHIKCVHINQRTFKCDECHFTSSNPGSLGAHKKTVHLKTKYCYACCDCDFKTLHPSNMRRHMSSVHQKFVEVKNLKMHVDTDFLKNLPHACLQCNHHAKTPKSLKLHIRNAHDDVPNVLKVISIAAKKEAQKQTSHIRELETSVEDEIHIAVTEGQFSPNVDKFDLYIGSDTVKKQIVHDRHAVAASNNVKVSSIEHPTAANDIVELKPTSSIETCIKQTTCESSEYKASSTENLKTHEKSVHRKLKQLSCETYNHKAPSSYHFKERLGNISSNPLSLPSPSSKTHHVISFRKDHLTDRSHVVDKPVVPRVLKIRRQKNLLSSDSSSISQRNVLNSEDNCSNLINLRCSDCTFCGSSSLSFGKHLKTVHGKTQDEIERITSELNCQHRVNNITDLNCFECLNPPSAGIKLPFHVAIPLRRNNMRWRLEEHSTASMSYFPPNFD